MICFIGSSIVEDSETLKIFGKKLKKNSVAVDLICFGDVSAEQKAKVEVFMNSIQHDNNSHVLYVEPGEVYLSERIVGSELLGMGGAPGMGGGNMGNMEEDPELAEAIRMSLAESAAQQAPQQAQNNDPNMPIIQE
jgi:26S proteasome regulatory subunit N10